MDPPVEIFFIPFVGGGHQIPMIDMARTFASHGAIATIIATPKHALSFHELIARDRNSGLPISILTLQLPDGVDIADTDMSAAPMTDTSVIQQPLLNLLLERKPDCIIHDVFHRWAAEAIDGIGTVRITFGGNGCFPQCVLENIGRYMPYEKVGSDLEPFIVPGLPDRIELTTSQLPFFDRQQKDNGFFRKMIKLHDNSFGIAINSFYGLEAAYVEYFRKELGKRAWLVGPVSLCNRNLEDKAERGKNTTIDEQSILSWLDSKQPNSVLYISFGSLARLGPKQLIEIAHGLEASNHSFIWVIGNILKCNDKEQESQKRWLPNGFEDRIKESQKGLIIKGWAPQLLILEHIAVGGFMTHCGWNSTMEGVCAGVPMITWPITSEQFINEKLITDVLKTGLKVGNMEWMPWRNELSAPVGRDKVETAVKKLMGGGEEAAEMRNRVKELGEKAKKAVEKGGSSYNDANALIQALKSHRRN